MKTSLRLFALSWAIALGVVVIGGDATAAPSKERQKRIKECKDLDRRLSSFYSRAYVAAKDANAYRNPTGMGNWDYKRKRALENYKKALTGTRRLKGEYTKRPRCTNVGRFKPYRYYEKAILKFGRTIK